MEASNTGYSFPSVFPGKVLDGSDYLFHLGRPCQKAAVDCIKREPQLLPLVPVPGHQVRQIPGNEFPVSQVVAVQSRRKRAHLVSHGGQYRHGRRQGTAPKRTKVMDGQNTFDFHGNTTFQLQKIGHGQMDKYYLYCTPYGPDTRGGCCSLICCTDNGFSRLFHVYLNHGKTDCCQRRCFIWERKLRIKSPGLGKSTGN